MSETAQGSTTETPHEISKKELLAQTGISYGQLYRWKREGLIPEEWFEKRSAYTGQETFFPRTLIMERIEIIQAQKEDLSLSEIRERIAAMPKEGDLKRTLLAFTTMSESFIDGLKLDLETIQLTELSVKALASLYTAMEKAGTKEGDKSALVKLAIKALEEKAQSVLGDVPADTNTDTTTDSAQAASEVEKG